MSNTIVKGKAAVAAHFGKSERQVRRWTKDSTFPTLSGRRFDLLQIQSWLDRKDGQVPAPATTGARVDPRQPELPLSRGKDYQEERLKRAKADRIEMDNCQLRGELVKLAEVAQLFAGRAAVYKQSVLGLEPFILALLPDEERRAKAGEVRRRLREAVENITRPLPEKFGTAAAKMADVAEPAFIDDLKEAPGREP